MKKKIPVPKFEVNQYVYYPKIKRYGTVTKRFNSDNRNHDWRYYLQVGKEVYSVPEVAIQDTTSIKPVIKSTNC